MLPDHRRVLRTPPATIDSLPELGGQVTAMYPEKPIYDITGFRQVNGRDLVAGLVDQVSHFSPAYALGQCARQLERRDDGILEIRPVPAVTPR
jgi:thioredoxin reductase (NADPH)